MSKPEDYIGAITPSIRHDSVPYLLGMIKLVHTDNCEEDWDRYRDVLVETLVADLNAVLEDHGLHCDYHPDYPGQLYINTAEWWEENV